MLQKLWVEKYRPTSLDEYIFQNSSHDEAFRQYIKDGTIPNLLLAGHPGTGKTALANILKHELDIADADFKVMNASDDNSVETVRREIKAFIRTLPLGDFKVVFLDEADYLTPNAQAALRGIMEENSDSVRFILTCNAPQKLHKAIKSRCQEYAFESLDKKTMMRAAAKILVAEKIKAKGTKILAEYVDLAYPDMRKLIQMLEQGSRTGELLPPEEPTDSLMTMVEIADVLENDGWLEARNRLAGKLNEDDFVPAYRFLYEHLHELGKFEDPDKWVEGQLIITNYLRDDAIIADREMNFSACLLRLEKV
jgi:replication factor C small subunit